jgi:thiamine biosynthesis lipoprotein
VRFPKAALALAALALTQCHDAARTRKWFAMDSNLALSLYGSSTLPDDSVFALAEKETARLEGVFSDYAARSALSGVKGKAGDTLPVESEVYEVLQAALKMGGDSRGAFDITLHDLKSLWGIGGGGRGKVPDSAAVDSVMRGNPVYRRGWNAEAEGGPVTLLPGNRAVMRRDSLQLDLGAIAKGFVADRLHALLDSLGCPNHLIQAGGEIRLGGRKRGGPWLVGIRHPRSGDTLAGMITSAEAISVSTSGDYERYFMEGGRRYHHIFDPRTGAPALGVCAVTVAAPRSMIADALSTSLFVLGPDSGAALARKYGAAAVWFLEKPEGVCAVAMPEMKNLLALQGAPPCGPEPASAAARPPPAK